MSNIEYLNLPRRNKDKDDLPYVSYSQHTSFTDESDEFRNPMILQYIFKIPKEELPSRFQIYADYGNHCGTFIEKKGQERGDLLSDEDVKILENLIKHYPEGAQYEREIWIDRGNYFILGYIDKWEPVGEEPIVLCDVGDFKTGNFEKKGSHYASKKYGQTVLYGYAEEQKGIKVRKCEVIMLDREGNPLNEEKPTPLKLTGRVEIIDTPYSTERAEEVLSEMDDTAQKLHTLNNTYEILSKLKIKI